MSSSSDKKIAEILGGKKILGKIHLSFFAWVHLIEDGFPVRVIDCLQQNTGISDEALSRLLWVTRPTLRKWKQSGKGRLSRDKSDRVYRIARIFAIAESVFESRDSAIRWLSREQRGLGRRVPMDLLRYELGAREVENLLGRIEYGVLS